MKAIYRFATILLVIWVAKTLTDKLQRRAAVERLEQRLDDMSEESFPSSDAPSSWAG
jgi:hypothetical protein